MFAQRTKFAAAAMIAAGLPLAVLSAKPPAAPSSTPPPATGAATPTGQAARPPANAGTATPPAQVSRPPANQGNTTPPAPGNRPPANPGNGAPPRPRPPSREPAFGDPLPGLTDEQLAAFNEGKEVFAAVETAEDGLGPVFTENSCGACHISPALGGASDRIETRVGAVVNGAFNPLEELGGSLIQDRGIGDGVGVNGQYSYAGEVVPPQAQLIAGRRTTPLFGLGLVEAVPDQTLLDLAAFQSREFPGIAGVPHIVTNLATRQPAVGRFGWKSQQATLFDFSGDAYVNEMGITTPLFPFENPPQGNVAALLFNPLPLGVPNEPDNGDLERFANFMRFLAPPPRGAPPRMTVTMPQEVAAAGGGGGGGGRNGPRNEIMSGEQIFARIGCAACHVPALRTGDSSVAALHRKVFRPWSDFLLHDMGRLGDGMVQGQATGRLMRTAPLWGLRTQTVLLHDGRTTSVQTAILEHDGQGAASRDAFSALPARAKTALLEFLNSL